MANRSVKRKREIEKEREKQRKEDLKRWREKMYRDVQYSGLYDPPKEKDPKERELYIKFQGKLLRPKLKERLLAMMNSPENNIRHLANIIIEAKTTKNGKKIKRRKDDSGTTDSRET